MFYVCAGHVIFSHSNRSHDRCFISHNAQKSASKYTVDNAQVACKQPVSLPTGHTVADRSSGLPPDAHSTVRTLKSELLLRSVPGTRIEMSPPYTSHALNPIV